MRLFLRQLLLQLLQRLPMQPLLFFSTAFAISQLGFQFRDPGGGSIQRHADFFLVLFQRPEFFLSLGLLSPSFFQLPLQLLCAAFAFGQLRLEVGDLIAGRAQLLITLAFLFVARCQLPLGLGLPGLLLLQFPV